MTVERGIAAWLLLWAALLATLSIAMRSPCANEACSKHEVEIVKEKS